MKVNCYYLILNTTNVGNAQEIVHLIKKHMFVWVMEMFHQPFKEQSWIPLVGFDDKI